MSASLTSLKPRYLLSGDTYAVWTGDGEIGKAYQHQKKLKLTVEIREQGTGNREQ